MVAPKDGIWAAMLTPYTPQGAIDYDAVDALLDFYARGGIDGVFVDCQSNEIFKLSVDERFSLAQHVTQHKPKSLDIVIGAGTSSSFAEQAEELKRLSELPASSYVLLTDLLDPENSGDEAFKRNLGTLLERFPDLPFGLYECPQPYKRLLSPQLLRWCAVTGRVNFMKETSCDSAQISEKVAAIRGTGLKLYNANAAVMLEAQRAGANGYCGPMCNFHPEMYARLYQMCTQEAQGTEKLHDILTVFSMVIYQWWPVSAKYYLSLAGLPIHTLSRVRDEKMLGDNKRRELQALYRTTALLYEECK